MHLPTLSLKQIFLVWVLLAGGVGSLASFTFLALAIVAVLSLAATTALSFSFATTCSSSCTAVVAASVLVTASEVVAAPAVVAALALASLLSSSFLTLSSSSLSFAAVASTLLVESWIETSAGTSPCSPPAPLASSVSPCFPRAASTACPWDSGLLICSTASTESSAFSSSGCLVSVLVCWIGFSLAVFLGSSWSVTDGEAFGSSSFFSSAAKLCSSL